MTLFEGDARDFLATLATECVDLVVTDPPYGVEWRSGMRQEAFDVLRGDDPGRVGVHEVVRECVRVVGQHRHLYVFGPADVLDGCKVSEVVELVWDKGRPGMGDLALPWGPQHERVSFAVSKHRHGGKVGASAVPARVRKGSVLRFLPPTGRKVRHPSEKPVGLLRELIESSSRQGEVVLDPFMGVGSTGVAAVLAGRSFIGCELDPGYFAIARERIAGAERVAALAAQV